MSVQYAGPTTDATGHWPRLVVLAVLDLVVGVLALAWPGVTVLVLAFVLGVLLVLSGVTSVGFGLRLRRAGVSTGLWPIALGALSVVAGIVCLVDPGTGVTAIALCVASWFLLVGFIELNLAAAHRSHRLWWGALGLLSVVSAGVLFVDVGAALLTVAVVVGVAFLVRAAAEFALGLQLRRAHRALTGR